MSSSFPRESVSIYLSTFFQYKSLLLSTPLGFVVLKLFWWFYRTKVLYRNYKSVALCFAVVDYWTCKLG